MLPERRTFTTASPLPAPFLRPQEQMTYAEITLCFVVSVGNAELKTEINRELEDQWFNRD
jgi:hypothetical protein